MNQDGRRLRLRQKLWPEKIFFAKIVDDNFTAGLYNKTLRIPFLWKRRKIYGEIYEAVQ